MNVRERSIWLFLATAKVFKNHGEQSISFPAVACILDSKLLGHRKTPANAESFGSDLQSRAALFALVSVLIRAPRNLPNQVQGESIVIGDLFRTAQVLDVSFQDAVQDVIRRQGILVSLIGAGVCRRGLSKCFKGDCFPYPVHK